MPISNKFEEEYIKLNTMQKLAVDTVDGPVMVIAGPGTGKTQVLGLRVANILRSCDVVPNNILCLTYTDAGAVNMRERLSRFIGADAYRVGIYTFHAFCNSIISRHPEYFYNAATFSAADDISRSEILQELFSTLSLSNPLASYHPEMGFVYQRDVLSRIKHLKSAGYLPIEYIEEMEKFIKEIPEINKILKSWPEKMSIKEIGKIVAILEKLHLSDTDYGKFLAKTLTVSIDEAIEANKMAPLTSWKTKYTEKGDGDVILKDTNRIDKIRAVGEVYKDYEEALHKKGLYDYDDMIIDVRKALEDNIVLKNTLEEQYQYILVDEFQDTNEAQLRLIAELSSNPVHEGNPNVMVVGDDDQAIFKFQGAEISNIASFNRMYKNVKSIVLDTNYRSHKNILDASRNVVLQGTYRLENILKIKKELSQGNTKIKDGNVEYKKYNSDIEEFSEISKKIKKLISDGENPEEIAVIAHKHAQLKEFIPYLEHEGVPYSYIRRASVFDEPHVKELITVCEYLASFTSSGNRKDELLPRILSSPVFNIKRSTLFKIAIKAKDLRKSWADVISEFDDERVESAFNILSEIGGSVEAVPLEHVIDDYVNRSGFKEYYFGKNALKEKPSEYLAFLASLKTFIESLRSWREGESLFASDVGPFVELHKSQGIDLISSSPFIKGGKCVQVMTAHKSKGLEFGSVYIIGAHEKIWAKKGRANIAPVPLPIVSIITPAGEDEDDFIRILYVALSRAKHSLFVSGHDKMIKYLEVDSETVESSQDDTNLEDILISHERVLSLSAPPHLEDELAVLKNSLNDYRLAVTHLNNFLNVESGGPEYFLEQNLLHFPQPMSPPSVFGSAIDTAITEMIRYPKYNAGEIIGVERLISVFKRELGKGRLPQNEVKKLIEKGELLLSSYLNLRSSYYNIEDESQVDFKNEGVVVSNAPLAGKIDLLRIDNNEYEIVDFKTGKPHDSLVWPKMTESEKIKMHNYKQQLIFYHILISNSSRKSLKIKSLELEFVDSALSNKIIRIEYRPKDEEIERLKNLIGAVYKKIISLDFPDISKYPKNLAGIVQFEDDLINELI